MKIVTNIWQATTLSRKEKVKKKNVWKIVKHICQKNKKQSLTRMSYKNATKSEQQQPATCM